MATSDENVALDPRQFVIIKPLPSPKLSNNKLRARSSTVYSAFEPTRDHVFWDNYRRRQRQLTRQGYRAAPWRPYEEVGEPLYLEPKRLILESLGQPEEETPTIDEPAPVEDVPTNIDPPHSTTGSKRLPLRCPLAGKREDSISLRKHLGQTRRLVSAVKQGRGYFQLLEKEKQEEEEAQQRERRRREEEERAQPRHPRYSSESSDSDSDGCPVNVGTKWESASGPHLHRRKAPSARPFTPVHRSLTSPQLNQAPREPIYRQLCCLNWLLEALSLDRSGRPGPITTCWDTKDPGRGRSTIKTLHKERAVETKWEQFVSVPKPRKAGFKAAPIGAVWTNQRKSSSLSVSSFSVLHTSTMGSLSSLGPGTQDTGLGGSTTLGTVASQDTGLGGSTTLGTVASQDTGLGGSTTLGTVASQDGTKPPDLQKLLDDVQESVSRDLAGHGLSPSNRSLIDSCPGHMTLSTGQLVSSQSSMLWERRAAYEERAEEKAQSFSDSLELQARRRLDNGLQRFKALGHVTPSRRLPHHVSTSTLPPVTTALNPPETEASQPPVNNNNMWLSTLLGSLPAEVSREWRVSRVLEKLSRFADEQAPRVRASLFLKVLGGLQPWELCLPDLSVAIELAREYVVQMPREEYDAWLSIRVST
ncbi:coiled-coil domain-containing protein 60-like [Aplochiton taeniatus]